MNTAALLTPWTNLAPFLFILVLIGFGAAVKQTRAGFIAWLALCGLEALLVTGLHAQFSSSSCAPHQYQISVSLHAGLGEADCCPLHITVLTAS